MGRAQKILTTSIWAITVILMIFIVTIGIRIQRSMRASAIQGVTTPNAIVEPDTAAISEAAQLPVIFNAPTFNLLDQNDRPMGSADLRGRPYICQFIFTTCPSICPMMMAKMARLQPSTDPRVQLVSFSVDPDHDRPAILKAKADSLDADPKRWHFLTNRDGVSDGINNVQRGMFQAKPTGSKLPPNIKGFTGVKPASVVLPKRPPDEQ